MASSGIGILSRAEWAELTTDSAGIDVVGQQVDAVQAGHGKDSVAFPFVLVTGVSFIDGQQFTTQNFGQKIAIATCRFEESRIDAFALMRNQVEHIVDQFRRGKDLAVVDDALTVIDVSSHGNQYTESRKTASLSAKHVWGETGNRLRIGQAEDFFVPGIGA